VSQQVQITFNIEDEGERLAAIRTLKATEAYLVLHDLRECYRQALAKVSDEDENRILQRAVSTLEALMADRGINLDEELP
jgi:hypothetical protein